MPRRSGWSNAPVSKRKSELPPDWQKRRKAVIARDRGRCVWCGQPGTHVDHIEREGSHDLVNLRLLCRGCHMRRTGRDGGRSKHAKRSHRPPRAHPGYIDPA